MKFKNMDPQGAIHASALGGRVVEAGEFVEVFGDVAAAMADAPMTWEPCGTVGTVGSAIIEASPVDAPEGTEIP